MDTTAKDSCIKVTAAGREWLLFRPADLESLWESITDEKFSVDERLPYWVELWPASVALADVINERAGELRGKTCLDIGCGLGLTAMAASAAGAKVIGMDYEPEALLYARRNAEANHIPQPLWAVIDWRAPALAPRSCSFIWGGDIMYERRFVAPVMNFLEHALAPDGTVWIAEPNRNIYSLFNTALNERGWTSKKIHSGKISPQPALPIEVSISIWELKKTHE